MTKVGTRTIERRALRLDQPGGNTLFCFSLAPTEVLAVADIARIARGDQGELIGYQRDAVRTHVSDIRSYLDSEDVVFPNPIILALDPDAVQWKGSRGPNVSDGFASGGTLIIEYHESVRPGWIVDGQQRALALADVDRTDLPVPVTAFITNSVEMQRDQFIRVNNTRPLPQGLVTELLPEVPLPISRKLAAKRLPSAICDQLQRHPDSPFQGLIKRPSATDDELAHAVIKDTSIIRMLEESLKSPSGCLFPYRNLATGETELPGIWRTLICYWDGVRDTFPEAWGVSPRRSRLMHGVGIRSMGRLMDKVMATVNPTRDDAPDLVRRELARVAPICRWTSGTWEELGDVPWNGLQNVPRDISSLSSLLIRNYVSSRMAAA